MDGVSGAASILAVVQIAQQAIGYLRAIKHGPKDRIQLVYELRDAVLLLEKLKDRLDLTSQEEWAKSFNFINGPNGPLEQFKEALQKVVDKLMPKTFITRTLQPLTWPFEKAEVQNLLGIIERQKLTCNLALQNDHMRLTELIVNQVSDLSSQISILGTTQEQTNVHLEEENRRKILGWLSTLNNNQKHEEVSRTMQAGTCQWMFEDSLFQEWAEGEARVLWCSGHAGTGKSVATSAIISRLRESEELHRPPFAFVYCNYKQRKEQSIEAVISSLLQQILSSCKNMPLPLSIMTAYRTHKEQQRSPKLETIVKWMHQISEKLDRVTIIIDALDEYEESDMAELVQHLLALPKHVSLLFTSRDLPKIRCLFTSANRLEIITRDEDVRLYLTSEISRSPRLCGHLRKDPSLHSGMIETVVKQARGMFLHAKLSLESLKSKPSLKMLRDALDTLPSEIDDIYLAAWKRIAAQNQDDVKLASEVLLWITFVPHPLKTVELRHVIAVSSADINPTEDALIDIDILMDICLGMITVDVEDSVRFIHYTAQTFFENLIRRAHDVSRVLREATEVFLDDHVKSYQMSRYLQRPFVDNRFFSTSMPFRTNGLHLIAYFDLIAFVDWWTLDEAKDVNHQNENGETALHWAAGRGKDSVAKALLGKSNILSTLQDRQKRNVLLWSAAMGHLKLFKLLMSRFDLKEAMEDTLGEGPCVKAALNGHAAVIRFITSLKDSHERPSITMLSQSQVNMALLAAASQGKVDCIEAVLDGGAEITSSDRYGNALYHVLATTSDICKLIELLLRKGCDPKPGSDENFTPLHRAAVQNNLEALEAFSKAGIYLDIPVTRKFASQSELSHSKAKHFSGPFTPLHAAALFGAKDAVKYLLEHGCNPSAVDSQGQTPLHLAVSMSMKSDFRFHDEWENEKYFIDELQLFYDDDDKDRELVFDEVVGARYSIVRELVKVSPTVIDQDKEGNTPLHLLSSFRYMAVDSFQRLGEQIMNRIHEIGDNIDVVNELGETALHTAAKAGNTVIVYLLLKAGSDRKLVDKKRRSVYHHAARSAEVMKVLLECKSSEDLFGLDAQERGLLHVVCEEGYGSPQLSIVELLLHRGRNPKQEDTVGYTPLDVLAENFWAANGIALDVFEVLFKAEGSPTRLRANGRKLISTVFLHANMGTVDRRVIDLLVTSESELRAVDGEGRNVLHYGAIAGSLSDESLLALESRGIPNYRQTDRDGMTPLAYARKESLKDRHPHSWLSERWRSTCAALEDADSDFVEHE